MVSTLVVTHGEVAKHLIEAAEQIIGKSDSVGHFCVDWDQDLESAKEQLKKLIAEVDRGEGVLLLTDIFGGTPTNIALTYHKPHHVEVVTGVNLPMIVKAMTLPSGISVSDAGRQLRNQAQKSIYIASELL
ncbi:PTS sugar transporter subunit IIA [Sulfidibacter corallicola]|uniref:PTS sugar transporter subunit IIA n=1 Tax=Sulfidibacter corallicola TaxID=2818388 RepID=A0A8A4TSU0_SULCO|nr:PTS sugar transporter subunit IIA [Sulfidibacter corallicola]QTD52138.1 PTS sugar transporter subunit IIA [Sulfidibacter corallicola]